MTNSEMLAMRKIRLEEVLMEMMIKTPYTRITVDQLTEAVGISRKTFYRTFPSKDACLDELIGQFVLGIHRQVTLKLAQPVDLVASYTESLRYWQENRAFFEALVRDNLLPLYIKHQVLHIQQEERRLGQIMDAPSMKHDEDILLFFAAGNATISLRWIQTGCKVPIEEMAKKLARLNHSPLLHRNPPP